MLNWIPAFAGMTPRSEIESTQASIFRCESGAENVGTIDDLLGSLGESPKRNAAGVLAVCTSRHSVAYHAGCFDAVPHREE